MYCFRLGIFAEGLSLRELTKEEEELPQLVSLAAHLADMRRAGFAPATARKPERA